VEYLPAYAHDLDPVEGLWANPPPVSPLGRPVGLGAKGPVWIGDVVAAPVVLDLGGGLSPGPPSPGRLGNWPHRLQGIRGAILLDGYSGGAPLPGQGTHHLPILRAEVGVGLQPAGAAVLVLAQLPLPVRGPVDLLGGHRHPARLVVAAAQPAKHAGRLATGGRLVGGQGLLGLLAIGGRPDQLPAAVTGILVELAAQPVPFGPQLCRGQLLEVRAAWASMARVCPPTRDRAWASCR
jgi:hypothetical protein